MFLSDMLVPGQQLLLLKMSSHYLQLFSNNPKNSSEEIPVDSSLKLCSRHKILRSRLHMFPCKIKSQKNIPASAVRELSDFAIDED